MNLTNNWISTKDVCQKIGISRKHLYSLRDDKIFKQGIHYRDIRRKHAMRATYQWHLENIEKTLNTDAKKR